MKVNPPRVVELTEKLMAVPVDAPKVAVPVWVMLPGDVAGFQFALALKSKLPSAGLVTAGAASQVASCAKPGDIMAGDIKAKAPIRPAAITATTGRKAMRLA